MAAIAIETNTPGMYYFANVLLESPTSLNFEWYLTHELDSPAQIAKIITYHPFYKFEHGQFSIRESSSSFGDDSTNPMSYAELIENSMYSATYIFEKDRWMRLQEGQKQRVVVLTQDELFEYFDSIGYGMYYDADQTTEKITAALSRDFLSEIRVGDIYIDPMVFQILEISRDGTGEVTKVKARQLFNTDTKYNWGVPAQLIYRLRVTTLPEELQSQIIDGIGLVNLSTRLAYSTIFRKDI